MSDSGNGIASEFRDRMAQRPDQYTLAWWREQFREVMTGYRGATHAINRCLAEYADCHEANRETRETADRLANDLEAAHAEIGRLRAELADVAQRQERMARWLKERAKDGELFETAESP